MNPQLTGIIVGGLLPAVFFALSAPFIRWSTQAGIGIGLYLICVGLAVVVVGAAFHLYFRDMTISPRSGLAAAGMGAMWAIGAGLVAVAVWKYPIPLSKLVPLYNMNTLIAVLLSLWIFAEWQNVNVLKLLVGALLVVIGGTLVALA